MARKVSVGVAVVTSLLGVAVCPLAGPGGGAAAAVRTVAGSTAPSAPDRPGVYPVGYRTVRIVDPHRPGRVLIISVWYPARPEPHPQPPLQAPAAPLSPGEPDLPRTISRPAPPDLPPPPARPLAATISPATILPATIPPATIPPATRAIAPRSAPGPRSAAEPAARAAGRAGACPEVTAGATAASAVPVPAARPDAGPPRAAGEPAVADRPPVSGRRAHYPLTDDVGYDSAVATTDAPIAPGRFPLVVFSHGSAGSRVQSAYLLEALASHGFVVAAPDHPGDTMLEVSRGRQASLLALASDRPRDVSAVIDAMSDPGCAFRPALRLDRVGVVGFSFGGFTSLVSSVGILGVPADRRVRAAVGIAPATEPLPDAVLAGIHVPVLLIGGTRDGAAPSERHVDRAFDRLTGAHPRESVTVTAATHNSFTEICRQAGLLEDSRVPGGLRLRVAVTAAATCWPPSIDVAEAHRITTGYTVAFLARHLRGDATEDGYLSPAAPGRSPAVTVRQAP